MKTFRHLFFSSKSKWRGDFFLSFKKLTQFVFNWLFYQPYPSHACTQKYSFWGQIRSTYLTVSVLRDDFLILFFASRLSQRHPLDYEGSAGLRWGDPRPNAQALPLPSWASRRPPLSCEVHGRNSNHDLTDDYYSSRSHQWVGSEKRGGLRGMKTL